MARLPYVDLDNPEIQPLANRIIIDRGSVLDLYQMLLHSPPLAEGWLQFLTVIRKKCNLSGALRELVIMRIAILNGASYEAEQHASIAIQEGVTQKQLDHLEAWQSSPAYSALERAVLSLADAMTHEIQVSEEIFNAVRSSLPAQEVVELTATIAAYNMVSRFLEAMQIHAEIR